MTADENQQLVAFLGVKFDEITDQFAAVGRRFDAAESRLTRVEVLHEEQGHRLEIVAEGLTAFREESHRQLEQVDRRFEQVDRRFEQVGDELRSIRTGVAALAPRMDESDGRP